MPDKRKPLVCDPGALGILTRLRAGGHDAFLVGGCVRDYLMGKLPKDWDIATSATPEAVESLFPRTVAVGRAFGVVIVVESGREYEVATFRGDGTYSDGRRPDQVHFTDAMADAQRRDFTINALMYDPESNRVLDSVGGEQDIRQGVLRTVGRPRDRFLEDHLRLLRAVRFAARTGFEIEPETFEAIRELRALVMTVSAERIGDELTRMLSEGYAGSTVRLLEETGLLAQVLAEVARMRGVPQPPEFHPEGDVMEHTLAMLGHLDRTIARSIAAAEQLEPEPSDDELAARIEDTADGPAPCFPRASDRRVLAWSVLLHDVGKPGTISYSDRIRFHCHDAESVRIASAVLTRLRRPNALTHAVSDVVGRHMKFSHVGQMREAKRRRFLQDPSFLLHLELHRLDCAASHCRFDNYRFALEAWREERTRAPEPARVLTGRDLMSMGYAPGPRMGRILAALDDAVLEGRVRTAEDAREWAALNFACEAGEDDPSGPL